MSLINELWVRRQLIWSFSISDLKIRYRNSVLGFLWTILEPLLMLGVLYVIFTNIFPSNIENYGLYLLLGIILWNNLSRGTESSLNSIIGRSSIITQIYFPREILVLSSAISSIIMLSFELIVLGIFMVAIQFTPPITILLLPLILILEFCLILGLSFSLSVLNVKYRDVQFIWRVVLQAGFFLTPIIYKLDMLPDEFQNILKFSPMVQIVSMAHEITLFSTIPSSESIILGFSITFGLLIIGYLVFKNLHSKVVEEL